MHPLVYRDLMKAYLDNKMSVDEFRVIYFAAVKNDKSIWVEEVSYPIQRVFSSLDAYWEECTPEEEDELTITEPTLRKEVSEAIEKLAKFFRENKGDYLRNRADLANLPSSEFAQTV